MKINVKFWSKNEITRYYITSDNKNLGYVEERTLSRGNSTYYDRHRNAKGDNERTVESIDAIDKSIKERFVAAFSDSVGFNLALVRKVAGGQPKIQGSKIIYIKSEPVTI